MKKLLFLFCLFAFAISTKAQKITQYTAINGITYRIGDTVRLGIGSSPNGSFLYLQMGGWGAALSYDADKGSNQLNIGRGYANTAVAIKKIKSGRIKGVEKYWFIVGGGNITNYNLTIDDAIQACEVVPCMRDAPTTTVVQQSDDQFDKLKKLKGLLDSGAITQSEYDEQKKKLLNE
jgi:hypothetical protein